MRYDVVEADEVIDGVQIKTYLGCYDFDKDFTLPRKEKKKKKRPKWLKY